MHAFVGCNQEFYCYPFKTSKGPFYQVLNEDLLAKQPVYFIGIQLLLVMKVLLLATFKPDLWGVTVVGVTLGRLPNSGFHLTSISTRPFSSKSTVTSTSLSPSHSTSSLGSGWGRGTVFRRRHHFFISSTFR